jgi:hypothetical protein
LIKDNELLQLDQEFSGHCWNADDATIEGLAKDACKLGGSEQ